jgi:hypothetical protein
VPPLPQRFWQVVKDQFRAVAVLDVGRMNVDVQEITKGIHQNMTFAPLDVLTCVIAAFTAHFGGFDALAVNNGCAWIGFTSAGMSHMVT